MAPSPGGRGRAHGFGEVQYISRISDTVGERGSTTICDGWPACQLHPTPQSQHGHSAATGAG